MGDHDPVTKADLAALEQRLAALEANARASPVRVVRCRSCQRTVVEGRFCTECGQPLAPPPTAPTPAAFTVAPPPTPAPTPARPSVAPATPLAPPPAPRPAPTTPPSAPPARSEPMSMERVLGQRYAPRIGAGLVFLAVVFFLGVAIQRGWIGPLAQLGIAVLAGASLLGIGAWLTSRRGYGTYPQILEATGASVLYVTAFVSHALPYYARETNLTELGGGLLMALVALSTILLALYRDARVIAGLGYGLSFITALLGVGILPGLTLAYVGLLGTSLAILVMRKGWRPEATLGSVATGGLLLLLAYSPEPDAAPASLVALVALLPAAAFLHLASSPRTEREDPTAGLLTIVTFGWATFTSFAATESVPTRGAMALAWALVAAIHAYLGSRRAAHRNEILAGGTAGVLLWLGGAPFAWQDWNEAELLTIATYSAGALALASLATRAAARAASAAALVLTGGAALFALLAPGAIQPPWERGEPVGSWRVWATLLLVLAPLATVASVRGAGPTARATSLWMAALFGSLWTFALFGTPILATVWLVLLAAALLGLGLRAREHDPAVGLTTLRASLVVLALAALKSATLDTYAPDLRLSTTEAASQTALIVAALLGLHHLSRARELVPPARQQGAALALVGGSALVVVNFLLSYATGAWTSILIGATGATYLAAGFLRRHEPLYRYTGFAILGFVLLRVFTVDLRDTDLAVRALVFAVLGALLLGIGYAYARASRRADATTDEGAR